MAAYRGKAEDGATAWVPHGIDLQELAPWAHGALSYLNTSDNARIFAGGTGG